MLPCVVQCVYFEVQIVRISCRVWSEQSECVLSGFSVSLFCFVHTNTLCMYGCMYVFAALMLVCVGVMMMSSA